MATTIDLTPTAEGFVNIAKLSMLSIVGDVPRDRTKAVRAQLDSIIEITRYLTQIDRPDLVAEVLEYVRD